MSWVISTLLIVIKGDVLACLMPGVVDIDVIIIITVYLLAYRSEMGVGIFVFGQGLLTDIYTGGLWGFYTMLYLMVFLFIRVLSRFFNLLSTLGQVSLISMAVLIKGILMVPLLYLFSIDIDITFSGVLFYIISALCSGLIASPVFYLLDSLGHFTSGAREEI